MSTCISRAGEYSAHETTEGNYICDRCGVLDEDGIFAEVGALRAENERLRGRLGGPCICNFGPDSDGPEEDCPEHGRTLTDVWDCVSRQSVRLTNELARAAYLREKLDRVRAALDIRWRAHEWMRHLGYEDEHIAKAEAWRQPIEPWLQDDPPQAVIDLEMACDFARLYEEAILAILDAPTSEARSAADQENPE